MQKPTNDDKVEEHRFRTQKSVAVVGLLALAGGKPVSREWLAETLWADQDPTWQRTRLRNELTFVTALLGKDAIVRHGNSALSLSPDQRCDLWNFETLRDSVQQSKDPETRIARMREAIAIAERGDFLPNWYEEPIVQARERLREDLRLLLVNLIQELWRRNDYYLSSLLSLFRQRFPAEPVPVRSDIILAIEPSAPPKPANRFWGRATELVLIADWLAGKESPILTLTGPPGIGKTRLAIQAAPEAVWVPCADITNGARLYETIRTAWGIPSTPGQTARDTVILRLRTRDTILLLDNLEQVVATVDAPLQDLLGSAPQTRCIVTSRVPLRVSGEKELRLEPLSAVDSRALFLDRARAVRPDFKETNDTEAICSLLDGIPLTLELAASHAQTLEQGEIRNRLGDRIRFLEAGRYSHASKHRSVRAAVEWSVQLFSPAMQDVFSKLCVFRGGFTPAIAEAFWKEGMPPREETLELLERHSLLKRITTDHEPVRYVVLPIIQEYGMERLSAAQKTEVQNHHARLFAQIVTHKEITPTDFVAWERDWENIAAALSWLEANDRAAWMQVIYALIPFWETRGFFADGVSWSKKAADSEKNAQKISWFRMQESRFLFYASDFGAGRAVSREAIRYARQCGATGIEAQALHIQGTIVTYHGDPTRGIELLESACTLFTEIGDNVGVYQVLYNLGIAHLALAKYTKTYTYLQKAEHLARTQGDRNTALMALFYQGDGYLCEDRFDEVEVLFARVIKEAAAKDLVVPMEYAKWGEGIRRTEIGDLHGAIPYITESADFAFRASLRWAIVLVCESAGYHACAMKDGTRAGLLLSFAEQWREIVQFPRTASYVPRHERYRNQLRELVSPIKLEALREEGKNLSLGDAHRLATDY